MVPTNISVRARLLPDEVVSAGSDRYVRKVKEIIQALRLNGLAIQIIATQSKDDPRLIDGGPRLAEYRNTLYMGNIHGNCINNDSIKKFGASYRGSPRQSAWRTARSFRQHQ